MNKEIMKRYHLGFKPQGIELRKNDGTIIKSQTEIVFETMTESFAKKQEDELAKFLYDKYKDTNVSDVYVLSKEDFVTFLIEMLPKWRKLNNGNA